MKKRKRKLKKQEERTTSGKRAADLHFIYNEILVNPPSDLFEDGEHFVRVIDELIDRGLLPDLSFCAHPCCRDTGCVLIRLHIKTDPHTYEGQLCLYHENPPAFFTGSVPDAREALIAELTTENMPDFESIRWCPTLKKRKINSVRVLIDFYKGIAKLINTAHTPQHYENKRFMFIGNRDFSPVPAEVYLI